MVNTIAADSCQFCSLSRVNEKTKQLECHGNPPTALIVVMNTTGGPQPQVVSAFAPVKNENWCGLFEGPEDEEPIDPSETH